MQPTVSPWAWVSSWDRRARTRAAGEYARSRDRARAREHDKYAFYGLRKDSRHFIRLDPLAKGLLLNRQWVTSAPVTWRVDRFHDSEPWAVPDIKAYYNQNLQNYRPYEPVSIVLPGEAGVQGPALAHGAAGAPRTMGPLAHAWSSGARGWVTGAVILALLVLLIRAAENCLHKKLFRAIYAHTNVGAGELQQNEMRPGHYRLQGVRRQESDEWSTPNVLATSLQLQHRDFDAGSIPRLDDIEGLAPLPAPRAPRACDRPPPYSACAPHKAGGGEEPPPPYSACYVAYTSPKSADPQVHIRRQNVLDELQHTSTDIDNAQNDLIENGLRAESVLAANHSEDAAERTELVFDNGRIVERPSLDNDETGEASNDNVEASVRHADVIDKVVYIDETASESTTPERALRV